MTIALLLAAALATTDLSPPELTLAAAVTQARESSPLRGAAQRLAEGSAEAARLSGGSVDV